MKASKILAILLTAALLMVGALSLTASAAELILAPPTGLILDESKFTAYKLFDVSISSGTPKSYFYTPTAATDAFIASTSTMSPAFPFGATSAAFKAYLENKTPPGPDMDAVNRALTAAPFALADTIPAEDDNGNGVKFTGLSYGYYLVIGTADVAGSPGKEVVTYSILCTVDKDTDTIFVKADAPKIDKTVQHHPNNAWQGWTDVNVGDTVRFKLESKVPDMTGYSQYTFTVHDTMSPGLTFVPGSVAVRLTKAGETDVVLTKDDNPGFTVVDDVILDGDDIVCTQLTIDFTGFISHKALKGWNIEIIYEAELNQNAVIGKPGNPNTACLEYSNSPYSTSTNKTPDSVVVVYTFDFRVFKFTGNNQPLAGAEFELRRTLTGEALEFVAVSAGSGTAPAVYRVPEENETGVLNSKLLTPASGLIKILGLDAGPYFLSETQAPAGFTRIAAPIEVEIVHVLSDAGIGTGDYHLKVKVGTIYETGDCVNVENKSGGTLPGTGGIGTTIFYIVSAVITAGLVVFFVIRRKRNILKIN